MVRLPVRFSLLALAAVLVAMATAGEALGGEGDTVFGEDATPSSGTTGDPLTFVVYVDDPDGLLLVAVVYSYGEGDEFTAPMTNSPPETLFSFTTNLPPGTETLHYRFRAQDTLGDITESGVRHVTVLDNDPPRVLYDSSSTLAEPGSVFTVAVELSDNDAVAGAWVRHWFDSQPPQNTSLQVGHPYTLDILVPPEGVAKLWYYIEVVDRVGNWLRTETRKVPVSADLQPPRFGRDSTPKEGFTGNEFRFLVEVTDDVELAEVRVRYRFGGSTVTNRSLEGPDPFTLTVGVSFDSLAELNYSFYASDRAGNHNVTAWKLVEVLDDDPPIAHAGHDLQVIRGSEAVLNGTGSYDNIGVKRCLWTFTYDGQVRTLEGNLTRFRFRTVGEYNVTLTVLDAEGNEDSDHILVTVREQPVPDPTLWYPHEAPQLSLVERLVPYFVTGVLLVAWAYNYAQRQGPQEWPTGPRSTSRRSQVGYSSTR